MHNTMAASLSNSSQGKTRTLELERVSEKWDRREAGGVTWKPQKSIRLRNRWR